jgi:RNA polymerase sigma factor (sigma-70 family)
VSNGSQAICLAAGDGPLARQPDERLLELVREGQERAFEVLVQRYRGSLLRYCRRFSLPEARAEDVLQQAFLNAWLSIRSGAKVREVRPWLFRIVHNIALNVVRAERLRAGIGTAGHASLGAGLSAPQEAETAVVSLDWARCPPAEDRMRAHEVLAGIAELPVSQREALVRTAMGGESYEQVASALGVSDGAVRGLLHRARASLRAIVAGLAPPPFLAWALAGRGALLATTAGVAVTGAAVTGGIVLQMEHASGGQSVAWRDTPTRQIVAHTAGSMNGAAGTFGFTATPAIAGPALVGRGLTAFDRAALTSGPRQARIAPRTSNAGTATRPALGAGGTPPASDALDSAGDATRPGDATHPIGGAIDEAGDIVNPVKGIANSVVHANQATPPLPASPTLPATPTLAASAPLPASPARSASRTLPAAPTLTAAAAPSVLEPPTATAVSTGSAAAETAATATDGAAVAEDLPLAGGT